MTRISKTRKVKTIKSCKKTFNSKNNYDREYQVNVKKMSMNDSQFKREIKKQKTKHLSPVKIDKRRKQSEKNELSYIYENMKMNRKLKPTYTAQKSEHDIMYEINQEELINIDQEKILIMVTMYIPIKMKSLEPLDFYVDKSNYNQILYSDLIKKYSNLKWVGAFLSDGLSVEKQKEIETHLIKKYNIYPIFIESSILKQIQEVMYLKYLDLILNNMEVYQCQKNIQKYLKKLKELSLIYTNHILKLSDEETTVFNCDYRLLYVNYFLAYAFSKLTTGLYWNNSFPAVQFFYMLPFGKELLQCFLCCSTISFQFYVHAQNFFDILNMTHGIQFQSNKGMVMVLYMGRYINIRIKSLQPNYGIIKEIKQTNEFQTHLAKWKSIIKNKYLVIGYDNLDEMNLITINIDFLYKFIVRHKDQQVGDKQIMFIQCIQSHSDTDKSINSLYQYRQKIIEDKMEEYNFILGQQVFMLINQNLNDSQRISLFSVSKVMVRSQLKSTNLFRTFEFSMANSKQGMVMCAEFGNFKKIWPNFYCFKILKRDDFYKKLYKIWSMEDQEVQYIKQTHLHKIKDLTSYDWFKITIMDLQNAQNLLKYAHLATVKKGNDITKIALKHVHRLSASQTHSSYLNSCNRLIFLDVDGCLLKEEVESKLNRDVINKPTERIINILKKLTQDQRNNVFIVTGQQKDIICDQIMEIDNLGIFCEYGYMFKDQKSKRFTKLFQMDWSWKIYVQQKLEKYQQLTQGSTLDIKQSSLTFKYQHVDKEFGYIQSQQLISEIKQILIDYNDLDIVRFERYIEIRPYGMNKGTITEIMIQKIYEDKGKIDFIMAIGNGLSDEEMFGSIKLNLKINKQYFAKQIKPYAILVGQRPSNANYNLQDQNQVEKLLENLVSE